MLCRTTRGKGKTKTNRLTTINRYGEVNLFYDSDVLKGDVQYTKGKQRNRGGVNHSWLLDFSRYNQL